MDHLSKEMDETMNDQKSTSMDDTEIPQVLIKIQTEGTIRRFETNLSLTIGPIILMIFFLLIGFQFALRDFTEYALVSKITACVVSFGIAGIIIILSLIRTRGRLEVDDMSITYVPIFGHKQSYTLKDLKKIECEGQHLRLYIAGRLMSLALNKMQGYFLTKANNLGIDVYYLYDIRINSLKRIMESNNKEYNFENMYIKIGEKHILIHYIDENEKDILLLKMKKNSLFAGCLLLMIRST